MKRICFLIIALFASFFSNAQSIEISAGGGVNLLAFSKNTDFDNEELKNGPSYTFSLSLDEFFSDTTPVRISFRFTNYSGGYKYVDASPGGGHSVDYEFDDYSLGLGLYPLNFKFAQFLELNLGAQVDYTFYSKVKGKISSWSLINPGGSIDPVENETGKIIVGITGNFVFNINLTDKIYLFPLYNYYMNFRQPKSIRHQIEWELAGELVINCF